MRIKSYIHKLKYIYWKKEAELIHCTFQEFNKIKDRLKEEGTKIEYNTLRNRYSDKVYSIKYYKASNNKSIYVYENGKYYVYYTNYIDDNKNIREDAFGYKGIQMVSTKFARDNKVGFKVAFGYVPEEYKRCVPKIFAYSNSKYYGKVIKSSSVDFSSHWPFNAQGKLPDYHDAVQYEGTVEPNEEYPFAFYLKSGHVAEYGVFDTHNWLDSPLRDAMFRYGKKEEEFPQSPLLPKEEDVTVLMKASKYELGRYYKEFYDMRNEDKNAKLYANASLGYMHKKNYDRYKMAHIVAIVLGRAQTKTIEIMKKVGYMYVLHAVVDGIIYKGGIQIGEDTKYFGNLHQEWVNKDICMRATNSYIVLDNTECIKVKHGGYECRKDGSEITKETVHSFNDFENWVAKRGVE